MISEEQMIVRLVIAAILGGVVGWNRERLDWAAGLRTHMLVCLGSCLFMLVSSFGFADVMANPVAKFDPSRVAAQVVSGIGFLGAGTIIFRRNAIRGLTTAASLWAVAAVGLASGGGLYLSAAVTTFLVVAILAWLKPLEKRVFQKRRSQSIRILIGRDASLFDVEAAIRAAGVELRHITVRPSEKPDEHCVEILLDGAEQQKLMPLLEKVRAVAGVREVSSGA